MLHNIAALIDDDTSDGDQTADESTDHTGPGNRSDVGLSE